MTAGAGIEGALPTGIGVVEWSLLDTLVGPQPLLADNSASTKSFHRITARTAITPAAWPGAKLALALTHYTRPYEEQQFDAGGGRFGTAPKPRGKAMATAQYMF